ncbi:MAG: hypothetical protein ACE5JQ_00655 [Candidatus Methylomirabilales bacterium]
MNDKNNKPTVDQRRGMAKLAEEIFAKHIQEARDQEGQLVGEITDELRNELGVDALDHQIDTLKNQIQILDEKKEKLGWEYSGFIETSKAGRLLKGRVAKQSSSVRDLEAQRKRVLTEIWTCESVEELERLLEKV